MNFQLIKLSLTILPEYDITYVYLHIWPGDST